MKITGDPLQYTKTLPPNMRAVLIYGPNQPLRAQAVTQLQKAFLGETSGDDFSTVILTPERLKQEPTALTDEYSSFGFFASKKFIHIRNADDNIGRAVIAALESPDAGHFLLIEAEELTPKSTLRAWAEKAKDVASVACYMLEGVALARFVQARFAEKELRISNDACALLIERIGGDVSGLSNQIEQLRLFAGLDVTTITDQHVEALLIDQAEQETDAVVQAVANQDIVTLDRVLPVLYESGTAMVSVLRSLQYYFYRLRTAQSHVAAGHDIEGAVAQLRPPLFFKTKPHFMRHMRNWNMARIDLALQEFMALEAACKKTGTPELILVQHRLMRLCLLKKAS